MLLPPLSSFHLISLFGGVYISKALPCGGDGNGLFPGNFSLFFFFWFLESCLS